MTWRKRLGWGLALVGVLLLIVWLVQLTWVGSSLLGHLRQGLKLADDPGALDPAAACDLVRDLRGDVTALRRQVGGLVRLAPAFGWLPGVGGDLRAAPYLLVTADGLTEAGALTCDALGPALTAFGGAGGASDRLSVEQIVNLMAVRRADLERAAAAAGRAQAAWEEVDLDDLSPWLAKRLSPLDKGLPLLRFGLEVSTIAPYLAGADGPRTYLILAVNEDERRPIGGYISGAGEVRVEAGQLITMTFRDSYTVDDFTQPYPDPPEPLWRYMGIDLWVFRDSNWSPDFPTAARQAIALYRPGYPVSVDGVIVVDQQAVRWLVEAVEPVWIEGLEPVTGETVVTYMQQAWAPDEGQELDREWWRQRKAFMGTLAQAVWNRVQSWEVDWSTFGEALLRSLEEKHLLIYLEHPEAAKVLAGQGVDGALQSGTGDFLMIVDANVGYNKASARVQQEIVYEVDLQASPPQATLTLVYTHTSSVDYPCRPEVRYDPAYEQMMDRCHWDYIRVYVPQGSQLLNATQIPVPGEALSSGEGESGAITVQPADEGPWVTFGVLGLLAPSESQVRSFTWTLPPGMVQWEARRGRYTLWVQKQPGTLGHPLTVRVRLPEGSTLLEVMPEPPVMEGDWVVYQTVLDRDRAFELYFEGER